MSVTTTEDATLIELRRIIAEVIDVEEEKITGDAHFVKDLGVDSLMALEVMVTLEKRYHVKISEQELRQITSLSNVYDLLIAKTR